MVSCFTQPLIFYGPASSWSCHRLIRTGTLSPRRTLQTNTVGDHQGRINKAQHMSSNAAYPAIATDPLSNQLPRNQPYTPVWLSMDPRQQSTAHSRSIDQTPNTYSRWQQAS
ncbi:MAG: hypothetical protein FRX48_02204 [Lasallia pustulata]|uniref:Uncharacterized protein n=1 Tax=Lasallia pustulata TaxID=136370 RepID=A0A5M8PY10_9LECA|nr:MAG: hypothetical protein FRX48_02204 [Lasallia pustulata]